ncbi:uncharacterized protein PgNI_01494 [Pyricularia grisea]|uniref:AAA+ ATPase domain-containing protein n=1 Tax=Pyricularia grisea TaxID=148305 RepID=A0A6P8BJR7_PYRGI|nr:uncharacterized protein PgNI_01494 [Pyricularia grisea]TLD17033.1 hypothetical protein PgNI_01494 [Pyricularia grisea]
MRTVTKRPTREQKDQDEADTITEEEKRKREELEKAPMRAELMHLDKRWTKKGKAYFAEPKEDEEIPDQKVNWWSQFALTITRVYDTQNRVVTETSLSVNSLAIKDVLRDIIGEFPGISFHTKDISLKFDPKVLYHYYPELRERTEELKKEDPESESAAHMGLLIEFISEHFADKIKEVENLKQRGLITYPLLWTIFRPGIMLYSTVLGQSRAFKLVSYDYVNTRCGPALQLAGQYVDFDGDDFGLRVSHLLIPEMGGAIPIDSLPVFPMSFHPNPEAVQKFLLERGRKFEAHAGQHFVEYRGIALDEEHNRFNIDSRTMIDCFTHHRINGNTSFSVTPFLSSLATHEKNRRRKQKHKANEVELVTSGEKTYTALTDDQCILASALVRGFSFAEKRFFDLFIDSVRPINWNAGCFEQLVLPDSQKELVQALVAEHTQRAADSFDDIVKGKGKGLILVLHGPPGVGKTLTAECVAEFSRRPLYIVSSGDLGTSAAALDDRLARTLDLASAWKAVLLIDEADVFLERRSLHDMERNSLVSIFLRTLEYYSGILFMTTNRIKTFDDAFKSRIHVPLRYGDLPVSSRVRIWRNFLGAVDGGVDIDDQGYDKLAEGDLNGRQIKNVVRTAKSLAAYKRRKLDFEQLRQVMEIQMAFEDDLTLTEEDAEMTD